MNRFCRSILAPAFGPLRRRFLHMSVPSMANHKIAVVLSGAGVYDGSEVHEASATWVHLSRRDAQVSFYAPNVDQLHVIDHSSGQPMEGEKRNVLVESARISRGNIHPLTDLLAENHDAVVFPGGFGAAKNLSTFAVDGSKANVNDQVRRVITSFHTAKKPIGLCCISPVLAAKVIPGCTVTIGNDADTAKAVEEMGSKHSERSIHEACVDSENQIVTAAAFMYDAKVCDVFDSVGAMINALYKLLK
ncbi:putative glutamine amidotransferase-like class 1 domain-containing protein 3B, mitochondrial [Oscarella lobularis]|uniref:putative glutamine amidotransferase-like class 1 domain-containing protein 3B, mitochondrial n=1 Tax=Oscarella lobularis TaxID=121494 RepID=UPI0033130E78